jgi:GTP-binding protein
MIVPEPRVAPEATPARAPHPLIGATFVIAAAEPAQLPPPGPPEIAFAGRSNAGKSSAINALATRTRLAYASRTPGRTRQIVLFRLASGAYVADLPGYGYAAVPKAVKESWQAFLWSYLTTRQTLVALVTMVDIRHGLKAADELLLDAFLPSGRPVLLLATKADKLPVAARRQALAAIRGALDARYAARAAQVRTIAFSALRREGIEEAERVIAAWLPQDRAGAPADA